MSALSFLHKGNQLLQFDYKLFTSYNFNISKRRKAKKNRKTIIKYRKTLTSDIAVSCFL